MKPLESKKVSDMDKTITPPEKTKRTANDDGYSGETIFQRQKREQQEELRNIARGEPEGKLLGGDNWDDAIDDITQKDAWKERRKQSIENTYYDNINHQKEVYDHPYSKWFKNVAAINRFERYAKQLKDLRLEQLEFQYQNGKYYNNRLVIKPSERKENNDRIKKINDLVDSTAKEVHQRNEIGKAFAPYESGPSSSS